MSDPERSALSSNPLAALPTENVLISTADISQYTGIKKQTHNRWRHEGHGPKFLKLGRNIFYRADDVREWMDGCYQTNTQGKELNQLDTSLEGNSTRSTKLDIKKFKQ